MGRLVVEVCRKSIMKVKEDKNKGMMLNGEEGLKCKVLLNVMRF